jgi:hypothetical protein
MENFQYDQPVASVECNHQTRIGMDQTYEGGIDVYAGLFLS